MAERLGLAVIPGVGWSAAETQAVAREAEEAGFDAIFTAEVNWRSTTGICWRNSGSSPAC